MEFGQRDALSFLQSETTYSVIELPFRDRGKRLPFGRYLVMIDEIRQDAAGEITFWTRPFLSV